jgi:hypothetical protein
LSLALGTVLCVELCSAAQAGNDSQVLPVATGSVELGKSGTNQTKSATDHWAFHAPIRPQLPALKQPGWPRTPIDHFVLARLEKAGLQPSAEADRITLLRRLSLDLIGLPPTIAEVDAFLGDTSSSAWEKQVERLLASPHYGERWGRLWLDGARYADSNGYEKDRAREMWHYRDWVVNALNADLPYDQFIIEQVAGDLLPPATQDQLIATGFFRNSMINEEGAIDPEQFRMDAMFDRMDCLGKAVLGLTIQCAQCHDHKYDPLKQEEYYRLFAFLNNVDEFTAPVYDATSLSKRDRVVREIHETETELQRGQPGWEDRMAAWEESVRHDQPQWVVPDLIEYGDPGGLSKLQLQKDKSLLAGGHRFTGGTWRILVRTTLTNIAAVRLETLANANLPMLGPGRSGNGLFALKEFTLKIAPLNEPTNQTKVSFTDATADFEQARTPPGEPAKDADIFGPVKLAIDGNEKTAWAIDAGPGRRNTDRKAVFRAASNFGFPGGTELTFGLSCHDEIGCLRLSLTTATNAVADPLPKKIQELLAVPREQRSPEQTTALFSYWRTTVPEFSEVNGRIEKLWKEYPESTGATLALHTRADTRETSVLKRGDWLKPEKRISPGVPAFLHPLPDEADPSRLSLARWLVDKRSPTTARVFVNRVWQAYFGIGLVSTPEDFGRQADTPSHPELLDWLACEFMEPQSENLELRIPHSALRTPTPWSVKHLHRLIVNSASYRQASRVTPALYAQDPYNRLLARGARFRVEGEAVRDIALAVSGLLNPKLGGPSLYTPAPAFLFVPPTSYSPFPWQDVTGPDRYRRALYTFRRRSTPYPMLENFDTPNGDAACVRRGRSNTPLQALTSLNETLFIECAQALARNILAEGGTSDDQRIQYAFRRVTARPPTAKEQGQLLSLLERQKKHLAEGWVSVGELATGTNAVPANLPKGGTPTQLAAYSVLSRVLLNLDETITKE